jgi:alkylglycerol monooxygenase
LELNPIGLAVPAFVVLIAIEYVWARLVGRKLFRLNDTVGDLSCGMGDQMIGIVVGVLTFGIYTAVHSRFAWFQMDPKAPLTWAFGLVSVDFLYYWFHRFSHRVNVGWSTHVVHHQSEEYNLAVALRQPWFSQFHAWLFYIPLAFLGLPAEVWVGSYAANLLYQFWIHTQLIGSLGPMEWVMNTPSHHRVHHGTNPAYIDKNYAGMFIVWDRIFGTFEVENDEPVYGVMKPVRTWNAVVANVAPLRDLFMASANQAGWKNKLRMLFAEPGWTSEGAQVPEFPSPLRGYDAGAEKGQDGYIVAHLLPVSIVTGLVIAHSELWPRSWLCLGAGYILWTALNWAGLLEGRPWARWSEPVRLVTVGASSGWLAMQLPLGVGSAALAGLGALSLLSLAWASKD